MRAQNKGIVRLLGIVAISFITAFCSHSDQEPMTEAVESSEATAEGADGFDSDVNELEMPSENGAYDAETDLDIDGDGEADENLEESAQGENLPLPMSDAMSSEMVVEEDAESPMPVVEGISTDDLASVELSEPVMKDESFDVSDMADESIAFEDGVTPTPSIPVETEASVVQVGFDEPAPEAANAEIPAVTPSASNGEYIVQPGDTLGRIAKTVYGSSARYHELAALNGLTAHSRLLPGDVVKFDDSDSTAQSYVAEVAHAAVLQHTVKSGETLSKIAQMLYGRADAWGYLYRQNQDQVRNPNHIMVGQVLNYRSPSQAFVKK